MSAPATSGLGRHLPALDGLRGVAILLVMWHHAPLLFHVHADTWLGRYWRGGWVGVDLFFALSGFLITSILVRARARREPMRVFWIRRSLRILPLAWLYLTILWALWIFDLPLAPHGMTSEGWIWFYAYLGNFYIATHGWTDATLGMLWSLSVEEQFYLAWPFVVRLSPRLVPVVAVVLVLAVSPVFRLLMHASRGYPASFVSTLCRTDGLLLGALLAVMASHARWGPRVLRACRWLMPIALAGIVYAYVTPYGPGARYGARFLLWGWPFLDLGFVIVVGAAADPPAIVSRVLAWPPLRWVGERSYGLYVWHDIVAYAMHLVVPRIMREEPVVFLWAALTFAFAELSWRAFEAPLLALKDRWAPVGGRPAAA